MKKICRTFHVNALNNALNNVMGGKIKAAGVLEVADIAERWTEIMT